MVVLSKIKGSTLMETLVATVLIVIVFMVSSMILNNIFSNVVASDRQAIHTRVNELIYMAGHKKLKAPYTEDFKTWDISLVLDNSKKGYVLTAINQNNNQEIKRFIYGD